ncbi:hypothetical protein [Mycobacterium sp. 29Ha]|uniref:hypothetical protein n=1 Tax=Mycobacterium sp. 29Ha TaxID=2939268 RepID=UPI00293907E4|nr:hypothetical protein [Mycobacterium sp. 29Ha]MDV3136722.1 hypothetical protein [Mycobacterium sp. 29Ha]
MVDRDPREWDSVDIGSDYRRCGSTGDTLRRAGSEPAISLPHRVSDQRDRGGMLGIFQDTLKTFGTFVF